MGRRRRRCRGLSGGRRRARREDLANGGSAISRRFAPVPIVSSRLYSPIHLTFRTLECVV